MNEDWRLARDSAQVGFMAAASRVIEANTPPNCPDCHAEGVRFYYHEFHSQPRRSGTIWIWCAQCRTWDHVSRIELSLSYRYNDPFGELSGYSIDLVEQYGLLDRVNQMWESGEIPHSFDIHET